ncbi:MAG: site-specific DNA-methyltransferase [Dehalococcoidia bacterium]|nr:site-specific DNA-methyltransferase [Dehalococcoidia bacterium]
MLTQQESRVQVKDYGTFKDSLRAPVHRWFQYPAGYSYKFIEAKAKEYRLAASSWVLDPFVGCGTTCVTLKQLGINSIGIEAHPFVYWVAKTKLYWEFDLSNLHADIERFWRSVLEGINHGQVSFADTKSLPPLVHKCFSQDNLSKLVFLRDTIERFASDEHTKDLLRLALTATLRLASRAGAGWPYIAPSRYHEKHEQEAFSTFYRLVGQMYQDLLYITARAVPQDTQCLLIQGDARDHHPTIPPSSIDLVITSPPYLNNYDYADRTRLEMYFFGWASSWRDITQNVRARLITAATTQITGNNAESGTSATTRYKTHSTTGLC